MWRADLGRSAGPLASARVCRPLGHPTPIGRLQGAPVATNGVANKGLAANGAVTATRTRLAAFT